MRKLSVLFTVYMIFGLNLCHSLKYDDAKLYPNGIGKPSGYCRRELDLTILVDESSSIQKQEWEKLIVFLKSLIRSINIAPNYAHLSLVTFSTSARWLISYLDPASKNESDALRIVDQLSKSKPTIGFTYTGQALDFVRKGVLHIGARKTAPKAIILITDGESTQPGITSQASAMLRDEGVTMLVVGVKSAIAHECKAIVGCPIKKEECPAFFMTNWDDIIRKVGNLMTEVCETIPQDAVCKPIWSDWSPCNEKCGKGTKFKKLMDVVTIAEETVGTNGKSGKTCKEQFAEVEVPQEECEGPCTGETSIGNPDHNGDSEPEDHDPEGSKDDNPEGDEGLPEEGEQEGDENPEEISSGEDSPVDDNPEEIPSEDDHPAADDDVNPSDGEQTPVNDGEQLGPEDDVLPEEEEDEYYDDSIEERPVVPAYSHKPHYKPLIDHALHQSTHKSDHNEESTKKESFKRNGAKIAGGVVVALLMLGAGGGYAYYKKKPKVIDVEAGNDGNFDEATSLQHTQEGETYSVTDLDDGLWSESH